MRFRSRHRAKASGQGHVGSDGGGIGQGHHEVADAQIGQVQHAVDHGSFLGGQAGRGFLHDKAQFFAAAKEPARVSPSAGPAQQAARKPGDHRHQRREQPVNEPEGRGQRQREADWDNAEKASWAPVRTRCKTQTRPR